MNFQKNEFKIEQQGKRLDIYLSEQYPEYTRSFIKNLISNGEVKVNGKCVKAGLKLKSTDAVTIEIPDSIEHSINPQNIPLDIVYEDQDIAVINKPQGMVTHPATGNYENTLVNAILYHIAPLSSVNGSTRPGIVHRLDKDTSGLIIIAKNNKAHEELARKLSEREIKKTYVALVYGNMKNDDGSIVQPIGRSPKDRKKMAVVSDGKEAVTHYRVLKRYGAYTLLEVDLETGRTHQIRVHLKQMGNPIVGDIVYSKHKNPFLLDGQLLHAKSLSFKHPITGELLVFDSELPTYFKNVLNKLQEI